MIGSPKFEVGDCVQFDITDENNVKHTVQGVVWIVDKYGTFKQDKESSYDIYVEYSSLNSEPTLFKHISETGVELIWKNPCKKIKKV